MDFDIRRYNIDKLFKSGVVNITKPGLILHNHPGLFGGKKFVSRSVYVFEEVFVNLYIDSIKKLGLKKTGELWYSIGKDFAYRYFSKYKSMKINNYNIEKILSFFCAHLCAVGMSSCERCNANFEFEKFIFNGTNSVVCRNLGNASYNAGVLSGMMSFLLGKNIEGECRCANCPNSCEIIIDSKIKEKYIPSDKVKEELLFYRADVSLSSFSSSELSSFLDLLRFKIVQLDSKKKFTLYGKTLIPVEFGFPGVFARAYDRIGEKELYRKSIMKSCESFFNFIFNDEKLLEEKIKKFRNIFSALGFGQMYFNIEKDRVVVKFLYPLFVQGEILFLDVLIESFLNSVFNKKHVLKEKDSSTIIYSR